MSNELHGRVALITGASRGLGRDIAKRLADAGAAVALLDRKAHWSAELAEEIAQAGGRALPLGCDVSDRAALHAAFAEAAEAFGGLDVVVNNAMWTRYAPIPEIDQETVDRMLGVGIAAIVWGTQAAVAAMRPRGGGAIVNIASVSAKLGLPNAMVYCGVKAAVEGMTRSSAIELAPFNIRVNAVAPSTVATEGVRAMLDDATFEARVASTPLGRLGETADIAEAVLFLADPKRSGFVTGQSLLVDGGISIALR
ncbi:SDR family NAD(P)-dependent oxidoreductase [Sphingomonas colocasiae]|uniref:SDR family oxidoreductase n=1 Tax=Sphingomonas colocasiae TaxID=1848973 RepID=A0ABS7PMU8_9SPHN|nr:SDR family oxidoreductase [Sphingomonas colocasiae]MBY8822637.1 SDR family oxidoreductase [Sphingomonas colocasiae]